MGHCPAPSDTDNPRGRLAEVSLVPRLSGEVFVEENPRDREDEGTILIGRFNCKTETRLRGNQSSTTLFLNDLNPSPEDDTPAAVVGALEVRAH